MIRPPSARKILVTRVVAAMLLVLMARPVTTLAQPANPVVYRALLLEGNESYRSDTVELANALRTPRVGTPAMPWYAAVERVTIRGAAWATVRREIETFFRDADANDVSLIYISTSGGKLNDGADRDDNGTGDMALNQCTATPCDEFVTTIGGVNEPDPRLVRDDNLDDLFLSFMVDGRTRFDGSKIIVLSACYSGGLADGTRDLPVASSVVLMACGTNELSQGQSPAFTNDNDRGHMWFPGFLIAGLADGGAGLARADTNRNNEVTVTEWFDYASPRVTAAQPDQHPQRNVARGSGDLVVLRYAANTVIQHSETVFRAPARNAQQCACAGASCPSSNAPRCRILGVFPGPPTHVKIGGQDTVSGLAEINIIEAVNANVTIPSFAVGTKDEVIVTAAKVDPANPSRIILEFVNVDGVPVICDPVTTTIVRDRGRPETLTFSGLPQAESKIRVQNGSPGLKNLDITVNEQTFKLRGLRDDEVATLDVSSAMRSGDSNTITVTAHGKPGGSALLLISD